MEQSDFTHNLSQQERFYSYLSLFIFAVFLFFVIFGNRMPFGEKITDAEDLTTSNVFNQVVFGSLFLLSMFLLIPKVKDLYKIVLNEKFLSIFLLWCLITIVWSEHTLVSAKRYIQYITVVTVCFSVLLNVKDVNKIMSVFKILFGAYLLISLATILTIPGAHDRFGIWRGVSSHKNILGQISLLSLIFFSAIIKRDSSLRTLGTNIFFVILALVLIIGSRSSTALLTLIILFVISVISLIDKVFEPIGIRKTVSILVMIGFSILFISIFAVIPDVIGSILNAAGKDMTLTGRIDLWSDIWSEAKNHLLLGAGFQGYWVVDSPEILQLYEAYPWLPTQAHNGYLDILNEVGVIGSALFVFILIKYYSNLSKLGQVQIWKWFVLAAIIVNFTESQFIRPKLVIGVMFFFSYFVLFTELLKQEQQQYSDNPQLNNSYKSNSSFNNSNL